MVLDLIALDNSARVWIYQADRELSYDELDIIRDELFPFLDSWTSHSHDLFTYGNVFHRRFLAFFVDESKSTGASGCSIDKSVSFVKTMGESLNVDFFNRLNFAYFNEEEEVIVVSNSEFKSRFQNGTINDRTLVFDNLVGTKKKFLEEWIIPLEESWHKKMV